MKRLVDYKCDYNDSTGFSAAIVERTQLAFPQAYLEATSMALLAMETKRERQADFCILPFCHTVEAESLGGRINYGNAQIGPRAQSYICSKVEELLELPQIDFSKGRISQVLKACSILREKGEHVALEICGPFTILNTLIDLGIIFKAWRKKPEVVQQVLENLGEMILQYFAKAKEAGVELLSYADSAGGLNILGPKSMTEITEAFTYPFLKKAETLADENSIIQLCPKTSLALIALDKAVWEDVEISEALPYGKACLEVRGKANFVGQACIKNMENRLHNRKIKTLRLI